MIKENDRLYSDFQAVRSIKILPTMLEVICRLTGMGFAAVARVTEDRWLACSVRDDINFGLQEGGELKIETTICNEIRSSNKEVVIDHVSKSEEFRHHHTPALYGFESYISFPIVLGNGNFFGTLCAIDPKPAKLTNPEILGTFKLFTELLAFYLQSLNVLSESQSALELTDKKLDFSQSENLQLREISSHYFKELLRKISLFSDILLLETDKEDSTEIKPIAKKINIFSTELIEMLEHISKYNRLDSKLDNFEVVDLGDVVKEAENAMVTELKGSSIKIQHQQLPVLYGDKMQLIQMFFQLFSYVAMFSKEGHSPIIQITSDDFLPDTREGAWPPDSNSVIFCELILKIQDTGIEPFNLRNMFNMFVHKNRDSETKYGHGLAFMKRIVFNHKGVISVKQISKDLTTLSIILPINEL